MDCTMPGLPVLHHLLEFAQVHFHWIRDAIQPSYPLLPSSSSAFSLSQHQFFFFSNESSGHIRWPKRWSFSFSISPSNEYSGLIYFRLDWFDLQGTLRSLLQHHGLKETIFWHSAFFMVQLSHPCMTTEKTIVLTIQMFICDMISLL